MSDLVKRLLARQSGPVTLEVPFQGGTLTVHNFAEAEMVAAGHRSAGYLREEKIDPLTATAMENGIAMSMVIPEVVKRHLKGWSFELPFTKPNIDQFFDCMTASDRIELTISMLTTRSAADQKKTGSSPESS